MTTQSWKEILIIYGCIFLFLATIRGIVGISKFEWIGEEVQVDKSFQKCNMGNITYCIFANKNMLFRLLLK